VLGDAFSLAETLEDVGQKVRADSDAGVGYLDLGAGRWGILDARCALRPVSIATMTIGEA
jgi:hypothetical protein